MGKKTIKGRAKSRGFTGIPHHVQDSPAFRQTNGWDSRLLLDIARQYNGFNNGDLSATWKQMSELGWKSKGTLDASLKNLERLGLIQRTRQGHRKSCNLFALTWQPINECNGKLEVAATKTPPNLWKNHNEN
jgi:hypothetical protein